MPQDNFEHDEKAERRKLARYVFASFLIITFYFSLRNTRSITAFLDHVSTVLQPIMIGFVMAFLMNPMMVFFEKRLDKVFRFICKTEENAKKGNRALSTILSLVLLIAAVYFIVVAIFPNLVTTIVYLTNHIEEQIAAVLDWANIVTKGHYEEVLMKAKDNKIGDMFEQGLKLVEKYVGYDQQDMMTTLTSSIITLTRFVIGIIVGMFVSVYVLISKETFKAQVKKLICGVFSPRYSNIILEISRKSGEIFYGFLIGKLIDSIIIGIICYLGCLIMKMPYPVLVSTIVGVTNIIPVFGPYIGAVPTVIIIFLTEPMQGIYFLIFILILQQIDGNLIGPKILGDSTGISSFWVVFAVVVGAGFFGVWGMVVAVPIVAIIYYMVGRLATFLVKRRDLPTETEDYLLLDYIDEDTNEVIYHEKEVAPKKRKWFIGKILKK